MWGSSCGRCAPGCRPPSPGGCGPGCGSSRERTGASGRRDAVLLQQGVQPAHVIWLGAFGTGPSAAAAGWVTRNLLRLLGAELSDKVSADAAVLDAGGTVFHAGPLSYGPLSPNRRTAGLDSVPHRIFPARVSRATVAAAMLDEAENPRYLGTVAVPLER